MKLNTKRKFEQVGVEEDNDFTDSEQDFLGDFSYKKYKFIQAFSKLSIGENDDDTDVNNHKMDQEKDFDFLYADLAKQFSKNVSITYSERVSYKKKKPIQQHDKSHRQIKCINITDGYKDINLFKHHQNKLSNMIFNLYQEIQPSSNDSLVVYKGNHLNVLVNSFMSYLQNRRTGNIKQKQNVESVVQKESLNVILEESEEENEQIKTV